MRKKTHEEFVKELEGRGIRPMEVYVNCGHKMVFKCEVCAGQWETSPNNVLSRGSGCPHCAADNKKGDNKILEDHGKWIVIDTSTVKHPCSTCKMDKKDFEAINRRIQAGRNGYPTTRVNGECANLHKVLMPDAEEVDHINRDRSDARRTNLRACSHAENSFNKSIHRNNTSGSSGVYWNVPQKKWIAQISVRGKRIHLGCFDIKEEAVKARKQSEIIHYGEYAPAHS